MHLQWEVFNVKLYKKIPQWVSSAGAAAPTALVRICTS